MLILKNVEEEMIMVLCCSENANSCEHRDKQEEYYDELSCSVFQTREK